MKHNKKYSFLIIIQVLLIFVNLNVQGAELNIDKIIAILENGNIEYQCDKKPIVPQCLGISSEECRQRFTETSNECRPLAERTIKQRMLKDPSYVKTAGEHTYCMYERFLASYGKKPGDLEMCMEKERANISASSLVTYKNSINDDGYKNNTEIALSAGLKPYTVRLGNGQDRIQIAIHTPHIIKNKGNELVFIAGGSSGFNLSMFIEHEDSAIKTNLQCRDKYWDEKKKGVLSSHKSVKYSSYDHFEAVIANYDYPIQGKIIKQEHGNAYFLYDNICVDIHASQVIVSQQDEEIIDMVMQTILYKK